MTPIEINNLRNYTPPADSFGRERRAAVLVPLILNPKDNQIEILLTLRSKNLRKHGGEVALPGGRHETADVDLLATALREAEEEIGLPQSDVQCVTCLPPFLSRFHLLVTPVIGTIPPDFVPEPNPDEVDACFTMPLEQFLKDTDHRSLDIPWEGSTWRKHAFWWKYQGEEYKIYGLTADILIQVAIFAYERRPEFEVTAPGQKDSHDIIKDLDAQGRFGPKL